MSELLDILKKTKAIDLSHTFFPGIPHAEDMPNEETRELYDFKSDGFRAHIYQFAGQWGTHIDPPSHFVEGGRSIDQLKVSELILPLVVFDCVQEVEDNADYMLDVKKIEAHEHQYGRVTDGSFVAMKSGWSKRWPDAKKMANRDGGGIAHFPGWSTEAARFLIKDRNVLAFGHEPTDTDGGQKVSGDNFECESYILRMDRYQVEMLASLDEVPRTGSVVFVGTPKPRGGSGFPTRVVALIPIE